MNKRLSLKALDPKSEPLRTDVPVIKDISEMECVCVCGREWLRLHVGAGPGTHILVCVCVCVCVCERERERVCGPICVCPGWDV